LAIDRTPSPLRAITRISTACSWVNIDGPGKAVILSQVGQLYFDEVGQYCSGANKLPREALYPAGLDVRGQERLQVFAANPNTRELVIKMPSGPAVVLDVRRHACNACLQRMVRPEAARQNSELVLEVRDRSASHRSDGVFDDGRSVERGVEPEKGALAGDVLGITMYAFDSLHEDI
jgi:hypothetical protein